MKSNNETDGILICDRLQVYGGAEIVNSILGKNLKIEIFSCLSNVLIEKELIQKFAIKINSFIKFNCFHNRLITHILLFCSFIFLRPPKSKNFIIFSGTYSILMARKCTQPRKIFYCHSLPRAIFDLKDYYDSKASLFEKLVLKSVRRLLKKIFVAAIKNVDTVIANSTNTALQLKKYTGVEAKVIYPPCNLEKFKYKKSEDYFLSVARHEPLKRVDVIISAFQKLPDKHLKVASTGSTTKYLKKMAEGYSNIQFIETSDQDILLELYSKCLATIYIPKNEDFGITAVESQAAGKPVIGVEEGGLIETIAHNKTGILISSMDLTNNLVTVVNNLDFKTAIEMRHACEKNASKFSTENFIKSIKKFLP